MGNDQDALGEKKVRREPITAYLGLGSNMGDSVAAVDQAVAYLQASSLVTVLAVSSYLHTAPYGPVQDQRPFVNAVVGICTWHSPFVLLRLCQSIEQALGRKRIIHWGPRSIDVDILLYGQQRVATYSLCIPHPDMHNRYFVMELLAELGAIIPDEVRERAVVA